MGKIYDRFSNLEFRNEADVSQNFLLPLLKDYLGYMTNEILPEQYYPIKDVFSGVKLLTNTKALNQKPDFVICINGDKNSPKFIVDCKSPTENIDEHLDQLKSYAIGVKVNLLVITNGSMLKVYNVNEILFISENISDLDLRSKELQKILSKKNQILKNLNEIITSINFDQSLGKTDIEIKNEEVYNRKIKLSDFSDYLNKINTNFSDWQLPSELTGFFNQTVEKINPLSLHSFKNYDNTVYDVAQDLSFDKIENKYFNRVKIIVGETGIGKTTLFRYLTYDRSNRCLNFSDIVIPVFISLRQISNNNNLETLIVTEFNKNGFSVKEGSFYEIIRNNIFCFYLDGYDEINSKHLDDFNTSLKNLSDITHIKIYLSTRKNRKFNTQPADIFEILSLTEDKIDEIALKYLETDYFTFINDLRKKNLSLESKNTLLLTLMLLIFKKDGFVPTTLLNITKKIIENIKNWEDKKTDKNTLTISWFAKEYVLSAIAFYIIKDGNVSMANEELNLLLIKVINELDSTRDIPNGLDKDNIVKILLSTGLIMRSNGEYHFWHRLFLNYYASMAIAKQIDEYPEEIFNFKEDIKWNNIIIGSGMFVKNSQPVLQKLQDNIWLIASFLIECQTPDVEILNFTVQKLLKRIESKIIEIRDRAIILLSKLDFPNKVETFELLLKTSEHPNIKMVSLEEIAKQKNKNSKKLIYEYKEYDEHTGLIGPGFSTSVVKSFSNFGEEELLQVIEVFKRKGDIWTADECVRTFKKAAIEKRVTPKVSAKLFDLYLNDDKESLNETMRKKDLSKILSFLKDETYLEKIIESMRIKEISTFSPNSYTVDILANYISKNAIKKIYEAIIDSKNNELIIEGCLKALVQSKGIVPKEYFLELLNNQNMSIVFYSIQGLGRYPMLEVKDSLIDFMKSDNSEFQRAALIAMEKNGLFRELIVANELSKSLYTNNIGLLLDYIKKYKIVESLPLLDKFLSSFKEILNRPINYNYIIIQFAAAYTLLGEPHKTRAILKDFYINDELYLWGYDLAYLLDLLPEIETDVGVKIMKDIYLIITNKSQKALDNYLMDKFLETAEKIGTLEIKKIVYEISEKYIELARIDFEKNGHYLERPLRTIYLIGTNEDEVWVIEFFNRNKDFIERFALNRVLHSLGKFGSVKSLPVIREIAKRNIELPFVLNTAFISYENVAHRTEVNREITEIELLS